MALSLTSYYRCSAFFTIWQLCYHKQSQRCSFKFKVISIYSMLHCRFNHLSISLLPPPPMVSCSWLEALMPWSNQGYTAAVRMHIILHFNPISIDLHLLNIMIIARHGVSDMHIWLTGAGPDSLIKTIYFIQDLTIACFSLQHQITWESLIWPIHMVPLCHGRLIKFCPKVCESQPAGQHQHKL